MSGLLANLTEALAPERPISIVDVGASPLREPPYAELLSAGCAEVVGFEPQKAAHEALMAEKPENATFVRAAVGNGGEGTLHWWEGSPGMASLYPIRRLSARYLGRFRGLAGSAQEMTLQTSALDDLDEVSEMDLLKIDVQGSERDVLRGGAGKLKGAVAVITEMRFYQLYRGEPALGQLDMELRAQGFVLHKFLSMSRTLLPSRHAEKLSRSARSQLIDGDAVYIRPLEKLEAWDTEPLKRMALCAMGAFQSYDLALMVLSELEDRGVISVPQIDAIIDELPAKMRVA
ncbi:MAG: FkbM family methyltransferase [Rhodobacteraceae bacterium]|nr:FkbM family methyltransferase [Paracoccaceae bacterium]